MSEFRSAKTLSNQKLDYCINKVREGHSVESMGRMFKIDPQELDVQMAIRNFDLIHGINTTRDETSS